MRLWTIHPRYLDPSGLVAVWREGLLAQKVLAGETRGYRHHPQLDRFRAHPEPLAMVTSYLRELHTESVSRGYCFNSRKIMSAPVCKTVEETEGQLLFEWQHLLTKLSSRSPALEKALCPIEIPNPHPLFTIVPGPKQSWERG